MKVVVTGGSGQLGTLILERLIADPRVERIVALDVRPPRVASEKLEPVQADVRDPDLARHMRGADALFHLAFIVTSRVPEATFFGVNVEGSQNVFRAAVEGGVGQIVYASSIAAYGVVPGHPVPLTETAPRVHQHDFPYASAKFQVEAFLDALEAEHPALRVVRLRPAILVGTGIQNPLARAFAKALDRGLLVATSEAPMPLVWDEDVADAAMLALRQQARGAFNLAADDPLPPAELAAAAKLRLVRPPAPVLSAVGTASAVFARFGGGEAADPTWRDKGNAPLIPSSAKARDELGWRPRCPTVLDVVNHYRRVAPGASSHLAAAPVDLRDRVVVVTGAGLGIGRGMAVGLTRAGARVMSIGRTEGDLEETRRLCPPGSFTYVVGDVARAEDVERLFTRCEAELGPVEILVNNAAVNPMANFLERPFEDFERGLQINVLGVARCCHRALPGMLERGFGRVVNVGSFAHRGPIPGNSIYATTKAAVHVFTKALALDVDPHRYPDVLVNELIPGIFETRMSPEGEDPMTAFRSLEPVVTLPRSGPHGQVFHRGEPWIEAPRGLPGRVKAMVKRAVQR